MAQIDRAPIDLNHHKGLIAADEITGEAFAVQGVGSDGSINVNATITPVAEQDVDLIKVGGTAISLGNTTMSASLPVTIASNQTAVPVSGTVSVTGVATATNQTNGSQLTQIVDAGGDAVTVTGGKLDVNATVTGGTGSSAIDDSAFTAGSDSGTPMMGFVTSDAVDSGDVGVVAMTAARELKVIAQANSGVDIGDVTINNGAGASAVNIQDGGNTITVDGTVTANAGTDLNTSALLTTAAFDASFGTAGTADTQVRTIQGIASMTPVQVSQATASNLNATVVGAGSAGTANTGVVTIQGIAAMTPILATVTATNLSSNLAQVNGQTVNVGTGAAGTGTQRVTTSTDSTIGTVTTVSTVTAVTAITNALPAGTNNIGDVDVLSSVSATLDHGSNQDIDTSAEQITSTSFACKFGVTLRTPTTNTSTLWIGNSDVTVGGTAATDGIPLYPGDSLFLPVTNSNIPYAIASANNQVIYWIAV